MKCSDMEQDSIYYFLKQSQEKEWRGGNKHNGSTTTFRTLFEPKRASIMIDEMLADMK